MSRVALGLLSTARINGQLLAAARSSDCADVVEALYRSADSGAPVDLSLVRPVVR
jgi:hypothetical protein